MQYIKIDQKIHKEFVAGFRNPIVVSRGKLHHIHTLPGYIAMKDGAVKGLVTYRIENNECEIVSLDSKEENQGVGTSFIHLVMNDSREAGCKRIWLVTTNENIKAIRFYQKRGFDMKCIYRNAVEEARKFKPEIPLYSEEGIPVRHEIEFEMIL